MDYESRMALNNRLSLLHLRRLIMIGVFLSGERLSYITEQSPLFTIVVIVLIAWCNLKKQYDTSTDCY